MNNTSFINNIIVSAKEYAVKYNNEHITVEHISYYILRCKDIAQLIEKGSDVNYNFIIEKIEQHLKNSKASFKVVDPQVSFEAEIIFKRALSQALISDSKEINNKDILLSILRSDNNLTKTLFKRTDELQNIINLLNESTKVTKKGKGKANNSYTTNLNELAKANKLARMVGRDKELSQIEKSLLRKNKSSVILTGLPGVGKTAIIEGFTYKIVEGNIHPKLKDLQILSLNINELLSNNTYHGVFESRINEIAKSLKETNSVLFIDEFHMIVNAGNNNQDFANYMKSWIGRNEIKVIGCTTFNEYRKFIDSDKALARRFNNVQIDEPSKSETLKIVTNSISSYEKYYGLKYDKEAISTAIDLTSKFIINRAAPDKVFDLIDSASASKLLSMDKKRISKRDIEVEFCSMTGISDSVINSSEKNRLEKLHDNLTSKIFGQDQAITILVDAMYRAKSGLRNTNKTISNILLKGPTGVGKTECVKILGESMNMRVERLDMSEFAEQHTVSSLVGSPPGYVGFSDPNIGGGRLINIIECYPNCILLLDEIEKAHPSVFNILLQIMDYGKLTARNGKTVSFKNVILVMTSNVGAEASEKESIGFGHRDNSHKSDDEYKALFRPEFRGRLDSVIEFNKLSSEQYKLIIDKQLAIIQNRTKIKLEFTDDFKKYILEKSINSDKGARIVEQVIDSLLISKLSRVVINNSGVKHLIIDYNDEVLINENNYNYNEVETNV